MLIDPHGTKAISLAQVRFASTQRNGDVLLQLTDGSAHSVSADEWQAAMRNTVQSMTPAAPGTFILHSPSASDSVNPEFWITKTPVLAWAVAADGFVYPVTSDGINEGRDTNHVVLHPSGHVEEPQMAYWESYEAWEAGRRASFAKNGAEEQASHNHPPATEA